MEQYITNSYEETLALGEKLVINNIIKQNSFVALYGDLGAGKTAITKGIAIGLEKLYGGKNQSDFVRSSTFSILNEYKLNIPVFHFDLYRIKNDDDLFMTGFYDYFDRDGIIITEWSENIPFAIPENALKIDMKYGETETQRIITIG